MKDGPFLTLPDLLDHEANQTFYPAVQQVGLLLVKVEHTLEILVEALKGISQTYEVVRAQELSHIPKLDALPLIKL